jgi:hypothetical protein
MSSQHPAEPCKPVDPKSMPSTQNAPRHPQPPQAVQTSKPSGPGRKLGPGLKDHIHRLRARGHSVLAIARIIGVNARTIHRERRRDPVFRQRLGENGEKIADICLDSLTAAVPEKPHLAPQLFRITYPDRYHYRPSTITVKEHEAEITEAFSHFEAIASPEQMRELQRRLAGDHKSRKPR